MATPTCSFCNKAQADVLQLIASPTAYICNECVVVAVKILRNRVPGWEPAQPGELPILKEFAETAASTLGIKGRFFVDYGWMQITDKIRELVKGGHQHEWCNDCHFNRL